MPKNCPLNKLDSHACWECIFNFGDSCIYKPKEESKEAPEPRVSYPNCMSHPVFDKED